MQCIWRSYAWRTYEKATIYTVFFDIKYERRTYKHIGKDYGDRRTADRGLIRNFLRWYRKRIYNRKELKYRFCNTHEEWKLYLFERKFCNACDKQNMIKFLNKQKRVYEKMSDSIKTVIIPIYSSLFSRDEGVINFVSLKFTP